MPPRRSPSTLEPTPWIPRSRSRAHGRGSSRLVPRIADRSAPLEKTGRRLQPVQTIPFESVGLVVLNSVAAVALRSVAIGRNELCFDEAYSALLALESPRRIVSELSVDSSPPLYFLLLHLWSRVFGAWAVALRWCSVAAGVMAVPVVASLATRLWGPSTPIYAMVLLA